MPPSHSKPHSATAATLKVVLLYASLSGLWILFSDRAVESLFSDSAQIIRASMLKGWLFVAVTTLMLYVLVMRVQAQQSAADRRQRDLQADRLSALEMIEAITENSTDAIFAKDNHGRYILINRAGAEFIGKPASDILGRDDRYIFPADQADMIKALDRGVMQSGRSATHEETLDTAGGKRVFLATKGPLRDEDGRVIGIFGISRDITERKRAEEALHTLDADLDATLRAIPDLLFEIDEAGRYCAVHAACTDLLVAAPESLIGRTLADMLPPDVVGVCMEAVAAARANGVDYGRCYRLDLHGEFRDFELSVARKETAAGLPGRFVVISRDITELRKGEAALQERNAEMERFNRAAVGRELDMIALKRQVNALSRELGREPPYRLPADAGLEGDS